MVNKDGGVYATGGKNPLFFQRVGAGHYCMGLQGADNATAHFTSDAVSVNVQDGYGPNGFGMHNTAHGDDCNFMGGSSILLYGVNGEPIDNWFSVVVTGESF